MDAKANTDGETQQEADFAAEVARLRAEGVPGASGRLRDLFDFFADRGPVSESASQNDIAASVFGQAEPDADDATVRVYVHRLRKRLDEHYAGAGSARTKLEIPAGIYALRIAGEAPPESAASAAEAPEDAPATSPARNSAWRRHGAIAAGFVLLGIVLGLLAGWGLGVRSGPPVNAIWQPYMESKRPVLIVLGDYYIYGEIDPVRPEEGRLIRDFRVDSPADLERMQDLMPERFGNGMDVGLNYLPFSAAYGLQEIVPLMRAQGKTVSVLAASELEPDMLNYFDVIYVGLFSGMGLLEDVNFMSSGFVLGDSYDELIDEETGRQYTSDEARSLTSPAYYHDYAYVARFHAPGGALVGVVAGSRDTGLRGLSPIVAGPALPIELADVARADHGFEALFEITGQRGAGLSEKLLAARPRPGVEP